MSLYAYTNHGHRIDFSGVLTQCQANLDNGGSPSATNNPAAGYNQLYRARSQDPRTIQTGDPRSLNPKPQYLTDITYQN